MQQPQRYLLLLLVMPLTLAWAEKPTAPPAIEGARKLSAEQVVALILDEPELVVIDARKDEEYAKGHIEGAISLLDTHMTPTALARHVANRDTPVLFYCNGARCLRSTNAIKKALKWGYRNLYWFRGGWVEWRDKKLPIAR
jgi:rhodanese-related sulfurtransferase